MADEAQRANTAEWSTAYATRALVHATLAAIPDWPGTATTGAFMPGVRSTAKFTTTSDEFAVVKDGTLAGADELPTVILKQGTAAHPDEPVHVVGTCGTPFTKGDARELSWHLKNSEGTDAGF